METITVEKVEYTLIKAGHYSINCRKDGIARYKGVEIEADKVYFFSDGAQPPIEIKMKKVCRDGQHKLGFHSAKHAGKKR